MYIYILLVHKVLFVDWIEHHRSSLRLFRVHVPLKRVTNKLRHALPAVEQLLSGVIPICTSSIRASLPTVHRTLREVVKVRGQHLHQLRELGRGRRRHFDSSQQRIQLARPLRQVGSRLLEQVVPIHVSKAQQRAENAPKPGMRHDLAHSVTTHSLFGGCDESRGDAAETRELLHEIDAFRRAATSHLVRDAEDLPPLADLSLIV